MLYQYIWKHCLMGRHLVTVDGRQVEVLRPGIHNRDSGPDFSAARLRIDGREWAGNVEVHVKASDWHRHGHGTDPAYDNVILHVVAVSDTLITARDGSGEIPQTVIKYPDSLLKLYKHLAEGIGEMRCHGLLGDLQPLTKADWISTLATQRMQTKAERIMQTRKALEGDWERACFVTLARALGFGLNSDPLEMTARNTPLRILAKHSDDLFQLEALIFGQAGMLDSSATSFDNYYRRLCGEYSFLQRKYGLRPLRRDIWKFSKTRPQNFPTRRLALLAVTAHGGFALLGRLANRRLNAADARNLFDWHLGEYWQTHYHFGSTAPAMSDTLSEPNRNLLVINFVAPMLYAYGAARGDLELTERAMRLWEELPPENNRFTRRCQSEGLPCCCAADSQALIELSRSFCDCGNCLDCRFGHALLRSTCTLRQS